MDTMDECRMYDECGEELTKARRVKILDEHQTRDVYNETEEMTWVEFAQWLGY